MVEHLLIQVGFVRFILKMIFYVFFPILFILMIKLMSHG